MALWLCYLRFVRVCISYKNISSANIAGLSHFETVCHLILSEEYVFWGAGQTDTIQNDKSKE